MNNCQDQEQELLQLVAQGDQRAFGALVDRYTNTVYPYLLCWLKHAELAEEIAQDVFLRIWKNREKLVNMENFPGYIYVIARNRANTALKQQLLGAEELGDEKIYDLLNTPQSSLESRELAIIMSQAIEALPARRKEVFLLSRIEELTYEEIALQLNISRSAVRQHIVQALVFLRHYLKEHAGLIVSLISWWIYYL